MVRKTIDLTPSLRFESISAGKVHFDKILKETPVETDVTPDQFQELKVLYEEYCRRTQWPLSSLPIAFYPIYEVGKGFTTKCFAVKFQDGSTNRFSLDKALSAVAVSV